jgi:predicted adenine nucleotide alpha hydrolase (AANH) superfamily ATPase
LFNIFAAPSILIFSICSMCHAVVMMTLISIGLDYIYYKNECNRNQKVVMLKKYGSDNPNTRAFLLRFLFEWKL